MTLFIPAALFDHTVIGSHCGQICQYALRGPFAISNLVLVTFNHPGMVTNLVILDHILLTAEHFDLSTKSLLESVNLPFCFHMQLHLSESYSGENSTESLSSSLLS